MRSPSNHHNDGSAVHDLDEPQAQEPIGPEEHDLNDGEDPPIGDPFALAIGCDLLKAAPGVPGCWASMRCDCGRAFKIDLLTDGRKPCPGCGIVFSHCLLVGPHDDSELVSSFLDAVHAEPDDDGDDDDGETMRGEVIDAPQDAADQDDADEAREVAAYARHNAQD
jgi:hypothetical protein